jgi:hypothetical protein
VAIALLTRRFDGSMPRLSCVPGVRAEAASRHSVVQQLEELRIIRVVVFHVSRLPSAVPV